MKRILLIGCAACVAACSQQADEAALAKELEETKRALEKVREEKKQEESGDPGGSDAKKKPTEEELAKMEEEVEAARLEAERKAAQEKRDAERAEYLALQRAAVGSKFEEIVLRNNTYKAAEIKAVDDYGVRFTHSSGAFTIKWEEVPENYKAEWGHDPMRLEELAEQKRKREELAAAEAARPKTYQERLAERAERYEKSKEESKKKMEERLAAQREYQKKIDELEGKVAVARSQISNLRDEKSRLETRYRREDLGIHKGTKTHVTVRSKNIGRINSQISRLEKAIGETESTIRGLWEKMYQ